MAASLDSIYDRSFFRAQAANSHRSARIVLPQVLRQFRPDSVIDVGCGVGTWLDVARELGVKECLGVDGAYVEREALLIPDEDFLPLDLAGPGLPDAVAAVRPGRFDLVMCLEVAEHLPGARAASLVEELCRLGDVILFSAAIPFQGGTGHVNEQWPEFWALHFRSHGYACFDHLRETLWAKPDLEWWYAQNVLVFVREDSGAYDLASAVAPRSCTALSRVHPGAWLSRILNEWQPQPADVRQRETGGLDALLSAWTEGGALPELFQMTAREPPAGDTSRKVLPWNRAELVSPARPIAEAQAARAEVEARLSVSQQDAAAARDEITRSHANCATLLDQLAEIRAEAIQLRAQLTDAQTEAEGLRQQVRDAQAETNGVWTQLADAQSHVSDLTEELDPVQG